MWAPAGSDYSVSGLRRTRRTHRTGRTTQTHSLPSHKCLKNARFPEIPSVRPIVLILTHYCIFPAPARAPARARTPKKGCPWDGDETHLLSGLGGFPAFLGTLSPSSARRLSFCGFRKQVAITCSWPPANWRRRHRAGPSAAPRRSGPAGLRREPGACPRRPAHE